MRPDGFEYFQIKSIEFQIQIKSTLPLKYQIQFQIQIHLAKMGFLKMGFKSNPDLDLHSTAYFHSSLTRRSCLRITCKVPFSVYSQNINLM